MEQLWELNNVGNTYAHIELSHITENRIEDLAVFNIQNISQVL